MSVKYSAAVVGGRSALRVSTSVPLCEIGNDAISQNNGLFLQNSTGAFYASTASLSPYQIPFAVQLETSTTTKLVPGSTWISPHVPLLALAFDRYCMESLEFQYEPQATSTFNDRLVFAWTDDPSHPFLAPGVTSGVANFPPTQLETLVTEDSVAFMPWKPWKLRVPVGKDERFLFNSDSESPLNAGATTTRFSEFGAINCVCSVPQTTAQVYGILYANYTLCLFDPVPLVSTITLPSALTNRRESRNVRRRDESKEVKRDLPVDPIPLIRTDGLSIGSSDSDFHVITPRLPPSRPPSSSQSSVVQRLPVTLR
jgi:hypothetical protein